MKSVRRACQPPKSCDSLLPMRIKKKCDKYCRAMRDPEAQAGDVIRCDHNRLFLCYRSSSDFCFAFWTRINPFLHPILSYQIRRYLK